MSEGGRKGGREEREGGEGREKGGGKKGGEGGRTTKEREMEGGRELK